MSTEKYDVLPGIGQTWLVDFGSDTPFGRLAAELTFETETRLSFVVTEGPFKGATETVDYTTTKVRPGVYIVRWTETGGFVTHVQDWDNGTVAASNVSGDQFVLMTGSFTQVC